VTTTLTSVHYRYVVDVAAMVQRNLESGWKRPIRRRAEGLWDWKLRNWEWTTFTADVSLRLEHQYCKMQKDNVIATELAAMHAKSSRKAAIGSSVIVQR
jgi:hypothetical protein